MLCWSAIIFFFFFFNDTATTEIYTLSLHDALPIFRAGARAGLILAVLSAVCGLGLALARTRSEEHTSELQSHSDLVCRLLLEKKKKQTKLETTQPRARVHIKSTTRKRLRPGAVPYS